MVFGRYWIANYGPTSQASTAVELPTTLTNQPVQSLPSRSPASKVKRGESVKTTDQSKKLRTTASNTYRPEEEPQYQLGKTYSLAKDIRAMASHLWKPERGEKVFSNQHFTFFKASYENDFSWPVAFDKISQTLHPISHILHIKKATELERQEVATLGLKEYYFNQRLKLLSVETSPDTVLTAYTTLQEKGMDVRMEVLRDAPQAK